MTREAAVSDDRHLAQHISHLGFGAKYPRGRGETVETLSTSMSSHQNNSRLPPLISLRGPEIGASVRLPVAGGEVAISGKPLRRFFEAVSYGYGVRHLVSLRSPTDLYCCMSARQSWPSFAKFESELGRERWREEWMRMLRSEELARLAEYLFDAVRWAQGVVRASTNRLIRMEVAAAEADEQRYIGCPVVTPPRYSRGTYAVLAQLLQRRDVASATYVGVADLGVLQYMCDEQLQRCDPQGNKPLEETIALATNVFSGSPLALAAMRMAALGAA